MEHEADVLRVDGRGEVVEEGLAAVPPLPVKALHQVTLHVLQAVRVALEVREILLNADSLYLLHQKVHLVEEQDNGNIKEKLVIDYCLKDIHGLHESVCAPVFHEDLVVFTGGDHEQN